MTGWSAESYPGDIQLHRVSGGGLPARHYHLQPQHLEPLTRDITILKIEF